MRLMRLSRHTLTDSRARTRTQPPPTPGTQNAALLFDILLFRATLVQLPHLLPHALPRLRGHLCSLFLRIGRALARQVRVEGEVVGEEG